MDVLAVECLRCGTSRLVRQSVFRRFDSPECPSCGYLGWVPLREPAEPRGRGPRKRSPAERRLSSVA